MDRVPATHQREYICQPQLDRIPRWVWITRRQLLDGQRESAPADPGRDHLPTQIEILFSSYGWMSAEYDQFSLDNKTGLYTLHVAAYSNGECGDSINYTGEEDLHYQNEMPFSTYDNYNDMH